MGRNERVESRVGVAVEVGIDGKPGGQGIVGIGPGKSAGEGGGGVGLGEDAGVEIVEKEGVGRAFQHQEMGNTTVGNDGQCVGGSRGRVGEGGGGGGIAGQIFPIEGCNAGNAGIIPEIGCVFGRGEKNGRRGIRGGRDTRSRECRPELGGKGTVEEGVEPKGVGVETLEEGGERKCIEGKEEEQLEEE